jgi:hypothetical protein
MSTIKSSSEDLTLNADGSNEVKFQINAVEKASINSSGLFTSTTIDATKLTGNLPALNGGSLTSLSAGNLTGTVADARISTLTSSKLSGALPVLDGSNLTGVGLQGEPDFFTFDMSTASGTTVHSLTASFTPTLIWFNYNPNSAIVSMVTGWMTPMTGADGFSGSSNKGGTAGKYEYNNTSAQCGASGGNQQIWISSAGSGTYTVSNTKNSSPTGTGYFSLILFG